MAATPARAAAFEILLRVEQESSYAAELLHSDRFSRLSPSDHGLATELVMGVLRWRLLLDWRLAEASSQKIERLDPEVVTSLRIGIYQLRFLSRIPARAAIFESVELVKGARKRSAAPFVNAVLRKIATTKAEAVSEIASASGPTALAEASAHPAWLVGRWAERYGFDVARQICSYNQTVPETAIHVDDDQAAADLTEAGIQLAAGQLLSAARRVRWGNVTDTRVYREGRVSIQDEASQLVAVLLGHGTSILDCCAAPGSKTSLIARRNLGTKVVASELHPHRARRLRELARPANIHVVAADARQLPFTGQFERILVDVPCSGTGTLARNPEIKWRITTADLDNLQSRQIAILKSALGQLAPGGRLLYSTCSLEYEENEAVVEGVLANSSDFTLVEGQSDLERLKQSGEFVMGNVDSLVGGGYVRTLPGVHPCDGFFVAIIERKA